MAPDICSVLTAVQINQFSLEYFLELIGFLRFFGQLPVLVTIASFALTFKQRHSLQFKIQFTFYVTTRSRLHKFDCALGVR